MQDNEDSAAMAIRSALDELVRNERVPGIQYVVVAPGGPLFEYAGGWADIAAGRRLDASTTMMAYSMSKPITAAAILQLIASGRVGLEEPIATYLEAQPYGSEITLRQLLSHTSGIPNPIPLRWVHPVASHGEFDERAALAKVLRDHPKLSFRPGTRFGYSNIGYWLLGVIVERVTSVPFPVYVREHLFEPLGIGPRDLGYEIPDADNHAEGYLERWSWMNLVKRFVVAGELVGSPEGRWVSLRDHYVNGAAFGGLVGNARGFGAFLEDQLASHSAILDERARELFYSQQKDAKGALVAMTLGWHVGAAGGAPLFYKEGGGGGFHSMMRIYPASKRATVVMTNATRFDVGALLDVMDPEFLSE